MKVDLTGPLFAALEKTTKGYRLANKEGDVDTARKKAWECVGLLKQLAKNSPAQRKTYLERAEKWERIANGVGQPKVSGKSGSSHRVEKESGSGEDEFISQAESLISTSPVTWSDIGGLDEVKRLMMETIVIAGLQKPESIKPWRGILLFGPPGTGKTLLAAAAAGSLNAAFFDVKADKVLSKYFGESSKLVSALYSAARIHTPSIVFLDEFDALSQSRSGDTSEATRKLLSSLLTELDGLHDKKSSQLLLTLAATNTPWDLDPAVLSRFPRRINVPLPDAKACGAIIKIHTKDLDVSSLNLDELSSGCVQRLYSGRDLQNLCQQAMWTMVREENVDLHKLAELPYEDLIKRHLKIRALNMNDFHQAFEKIKSPVTKADIERYAKWNDEFGE